MATEHHGIKEEAQQTPLSCLPQTSAMQPPYATHNVQTQTQSTIKME